jgi:ribosome-associated protein
MAAMDAESIRSEIAFRFSRSSGPGGQHARRRRRAEALFDVASPRDCRKPSAHASCGARAGRAGGRQDERSQIRNRGLAADRILEQLAEAVRVRRRRRPTKPTAAAREQRLEDKRRRGNTKRLRRNLDE